MIKKHFMLNPAKILVVMSLLIILYWAPFICITTGARGRTFSSIDQLPESDAVLIFGTLVGNDFKVSPLLKERLDAGIQILQRGKCSRIVASNMKRASMVMASYIYEQGIDPGLVEIDPLADDTPDTCRFERMNHPEGRMVIFVSQGFHLPRILYQCRKTGVEGTAFPAEKLRDKSGKQYSLMTKIATRACRYTREAGLTWLAVLGIYR